MHHIKEVSKIVEDILNKDPMARNNDRYLYLEVVRAVKPELLNVPFCIAYMDEGIPSTETVRRSRRSGETINEENTRSGKRTGLPSSGYR